MEQQRSPTKATGGLTQAELAALENHHRLWVGRADRTSPIEPAKIVPAIQALYRAGGLREPLVVIVPSPGVLAVAGSFASFILDKQSMDPDVPSMLPLQIPSALDARFKPFAQATLDAVRDALAAGREPAVADGNTSNPVEATRQASFERADIAAAYALDRPTIADIQESFDTTALVDQSFAVREAMRDDFGNPELTGLMAGAMRDWGLPLAREMFGKEAEAAAAQVADWWKHAQSGNAWTYEDYQVTAGRDVLGLQLQEYAALVAWEACQVEGGYRYLHARFCMVCDFPAQIDAKDAATMSMGSGQRSYRWRDGWVV